jgi:TolB protein
VNTALGSVYNYIKHYRQIQDQLKNEDLDVITVEKELLIENLPGIIERPSFSVDGKKVLFTQDLSGFEEPNGRQLNSHIFIVDIDSGELLDLSINKEDGTNDVNPRFSSNGAHIIFNNISNDGGSDPNLLTMNLEGRNRTVLLSRAIMPDWK